MADPGFPVGGGADPLGGAPTSDAYTFRRKRMRKRKKSILLGGEGARAGGAPPGSANGITVFSITRTLLHVFINIILQSVLSKAIPFSHEKVVLLPYV